MNYKTHLKMEELLAKEGVQVEKDQIKNFKELIWDPSIELEIK